MRSAEEIHDVVRDRYGEIARKGTPLVGGCCGPSAAQIAERIGYSATDTTAVPEGANLGLGCGAPLAAAALQPGETVLDLGSGAGFDALLAAQAVGPTGRVIGVDMTDDMLQKARANAERAGHRNTEFRKGFIEALPVDDASVDVVISNCVINLSPDKPGVYREVARVLRPGGRMIVSDVVLDAPLPAAIANDVNALVGCVAGAALRADYLAAIRDAGLTDVEVLKDAGFGTLVLDMVPASMRAKAAELGVDVERTAEQVRSLTVRARKPR
ncbi:MAG TPA: arsenite methyltransferase [Candidatus Limnocylindria bacterium]|nr:arsenite methyltransferase [Candidatus Limnocylindria bacterium]